jgi:hypothetical protein
MRRLALIGMLVLLAASAQAGVEVRFASAFTTGDGRVHFTYRVALVSGQVVPGAPFTQHITIYDLPSLIPGSLIQPAGWVGSVQAIGLNAADIPLASTVDTPGLLNVTWRWTGTTVVNAPFEFGLFSFDLAGSGANSSTRLFVGQSSGSGFPRALRGRVIGPSIVTP